MVGALRVNHVSIHAEDMEESARFYEELFGMRRLPTPKFQQPVLWLALGDQQLHLFQRDDVEAPGRTTSPSTSMTSTPSTGRRRSAGCSIADTWDRSARYHPAGWVQMYIRDPSGNLVEIDWPDVSTLDPEIVAELGRLEDDVPQEGDARDATLYTGAGG